MTRGRKPKPTKIKKLEGNAGKRKLNEKEPKPESVIPDCPLELKGEARKEWNRITKELFTLGILSNIDRAALVSYCIAWETLIKALKFLQINPEVLVSDLGGEYQNPWLSIRNKSMEQVRQFSAEFGMTPSSRTRLQVQTPNEEDEMQALLNRQRPKVDKK